MRPKGTDEMRLEAMEFARQIVEHDLETMFPGRIRQVIASFSEGDRRTYRFMVRYSLARTERIATFHHSASAFTNCEGESHAVALMADRIHDDIERMKAAQRKEESMKVIYKTPVTEKIDNAIREADKQGREIERIEVTPDEFQRLMRETKGVLKHYIPGEPMHRAGAAPGDRHCYFSGVRVQDYEGEV